VESRTIDLGGPMHVADFGGRGPVIVLAHGLGGSYVNWLRLGPLLAERARVYAPDLAGFGRTPPAGRSSSLPANQRLLLRFLDEVAGVPAILVGNSMGGLIAMLAAASRPRNVAGLVLIDPAVPVAPGIPRDRQVTMAFTAYMLPGVGDRFLRQRRARLGPEGIIRESFAMCCVDPERIPKQIFDAHVALARERAAQPWADRAYLAAARSLLSLIVRRQSFHRMVSRIEAPTLLLQGMSDRLIDIRSTVLLARRRPDWTFRPLHGLGHLPHLEDPDGTASSIWEWLEGPGRAALDSAAVETDRAATEV
jgi:pimeloyl-ACP methyl ester carboxylesterase